MTAAEIAELARQVAALVPATGPEGYLDKRQLAKHFSCGTRSIEDAMAKGMPHYKIFGKAKFLVSEASPWLEEHGHFEERRAA